MYPEPQNDTYIDLLLEKAELFSRTVILYFERDDYLMRRQIQKFEESTKKSPEHHPFFDIFDVSPCKVSHIGLPFNDWTFSIKNFSLNFIKGWFMAIRDVDNEENMKWFIYMNGKFYFYDEQTDVLRSSSSSGVMSTKGKVLTIRDDLMRVKKYNALIRSNFTEFSEYLDGCFMHKSAHPLDSFITSFRAFDKYPTVNDKFASFYRFFITCPTFLFTMVMDNNQTPTQKNVVDIWIKAADTDLISIIRVWFFTYFKQHVYDACFNDNCCFFFDIMRAVFMKSESLKELKNNGNELSSILNYNFDDLQKFILSIVYNTAKNNNFNPKQIVGVVMKFIFHVLLENEVDIREFQADEFVSYANQFESENSEMTMICQPLLTNEEIDAMIKEITQNIAKYEVLFRSSHASTYIENYNQFLHPKKVRPRPPSDASFKLEANPAIRRSPSIKMRSVSPADIPIKKPRSESFLLLSKPNYSGDEEPPLEPEEHSDPTVQISE